MNCALLIDVSFEPDLEIAQRMKTLVLEFPDPAVVNLVNGHRVEVVELFAPPPHRGDQIRVFEHAKMLGDGLPRHLEVLAQFAERQAALRMQAIEQLPAAWICQRLEHLVDSLHLYIMQVNACMSSGEAPKNKSIARGADTPGSWSLDGSG